jgi:hypothetical protein
MKRAEHFAPDVASVDKEIKVIIPKLLETHALE